MVIGGWNLVSDDWRRPYFKEMIWMGGFWAERYFSLNLMNKEDKVEAMTVYFNGEALAWFKKEEKHRLMRKWDEMKAQLPHRFWPTHDGSLYAQFLSLKQNSMVQDYYRSFETEFHGPRLLSLVGLEQIIKAVQMVEDQNVIN